VESATEFTRLGRFTAHHGGDAAHTIGQHGLSGDETVFHRATEGPGDSVFVSPVAGSVQRHRHTDPRLPFEELELIAKRFSSEHDGSGDPESLVPATKRFSSESR
jgi:hypothetical protein